MFIANLIIPLTLLTLRPNFIYFIPRSEFKAHLKQMKVILSSVKKYYVLSLIMITIYIFHYSKQRLFRRRRA